MAPTRFVLTIALAVLCLGQSTSAQNVTHALFGRYIDALRQQTGIPGLAAAIIRSGAVEPEWHQGFGLARIDGNAPVTSHTPFAVGGLSQNIGAALVLRHCIETGEVTFEDRVQRWSRDFEDRSATFADVLSHRRNGTFDYNPDRFASGLTRAIEECADRPYARIVFEEVIARFALQQTIPGADVAETGQPVRLLFPTPTLRVFASTLDQRAYGHRVDSNRRATLSDYVPGRTQLSAGNGLVASAYDLARFEAALDQDGLLVSRSLLEETAWRPHGRMGYGWFVQKVNGKDVVWQFGQVRNAYSSMTIKLPGEGLTLVLLANSDGLAALFPLANGDITVSPFATIFFNLLG